LKPSKARRKADIITHSASDPTRNVAGWQVSRTESFARDFKNLPKEIELRLSIT
jgi:hypothetical protein